MIMSKTPVVLASLLTLSAVPYSWAQTPTTPSAPAAPQAQSCPAPVPADARCYTGQDSAGAFYWLALPANWKNDVLVMHAHGGPDQPGPATLKRSEEDLKRWAITVKLGYAWAGSSYRRGGYGVTMAAQDTERLRQIFVQHFGPVRRTLLHGQSYGGGVAAKAAELYATVDNKRGPYDGVLLTSGVLGGGVQAYNFRYQLRQVYQQVCNNHPKPDEQEYPLWQGLPLDSKLTRAELVTRVDDCTGVRKPAAQRTPEQQARLATILSTVKIAERSLQGHLNWATWLFQDLTQRQLGNRNPFGPDADPQAVTQLNEDSAPTGKVNVPVITFHAINDPTAFVELESVYRQALVAAGTQDLLVQTFSDEDEHSYLSEPQYPALFSALLEWVDKGVKPTPQMIAQRCKPLEAAYGQPCRFQPDYAPQSLSQRMKAP
jgi:pimeloyl-ACP methyl ester carboxylesterase